MDPLAHQTRLIQALRDPTRYPHPARDVGLIETHVSWILLAGDYAYKLKKAVDFGFLDYSTLERRRRFCDEELRLNRRTAAEIYLESVAITGTVDDPTVGGTGPALEYAVRMVRFPQEALFGALLAHGRLTPAHIDQLADAIARFHQRVAAAGPDTPYGTPDAVWAPVAQNFAQLRPRRRDAATLEQLARLEAWSTATFATLRPLLEQRRSAGLVRECHGDLHLDNIVWLHGRPTPFDAIEFNPNLRFIDVASEVAFLTMDLDDRGHGALAWRFLDGYLTHSGDYPCLALLRFYQCYRALVRAKVAAIRLDDASLADAERARVQQVCAGYLELAARYTRPPAPRLIVTHGLSGAGKSRLAGRLVEALGAVRLRSDVVRKRLFGLAPQQGSGSPPGGGIYDTAAGERTYHHLAELAALLVGAGHTVIVDAACLRREQRELFRDLARRLDVPFALLAVRADPALLHERVAARAARAEDPSEAGPEVLARQLAAYQAPDPEEGAIVVVTDGEVELAGLVAALGGGRSGGG